MRSCLTAGVLLGMALACPAPALAADAAAFSGTRAAVLAGFDSTELPNDDGLEIMYALEAGHDRAIGPWLVGAAVSVGGTDAGKTEYSIAAPGDSLGVWYGTDVYAGARAGRALGTRLLAYGRAGLALTHMKSAYLEDSRSGETPHVPDASIAPKFARPGTLLGFWVGAGAQYDMGRKVYALSEYRYSNFHDGIYRHQVIVGLGLRL